VVDSELRFASLNKRAKALFSEITPRVGGDLADIAHVLWPATFAPEAIGHFRDTLATGTSFVASVPIEARGENAGRIGAYDWQIQRVRLPDDTFGVACWVQPARAAPRETESTARLREAEARLHLALEASQMGTFVWHLQEDRGEPDERMLALFGLTPGDPNLASALIAMIHPDDSPRYAAAVKRATDPAGSGTVREDVRVVHPDGSLHWIAITARVVFEGRVRTAVRLVGMAADITERKLVEERLREREERLQELDRRKNEFLAMLSHELRNPLAPIRTALELIRVGGGTPAAMERVHATVDRQMGHMVRLIDDLLDVSRITSGKVRLQKQTCPLAELVDTAIETNRAALDANSIALHVDMPDSPLMLDVDPTRLVQILSNLLHNAIKFTPAGGEVRIAADEMLPPPRREPFAACESEAAARTLSLTITDSGIGISPEMLPRVFEMFTQGEAENGSKAGLGIGLALARRFVEMHGGSLDAESAGAGHGSTFTIRLPLTARAEPKPEKPAVHTSKIKRRIVVVDDNVDSADIMAMYVSALGGEAKVAYSGEKGLAHVLESRPDAVLLDIGMPGMDGYETCRRIREELGSEVLVVAMTGWGQEQDKQTARDAGFDAHLTKPVNLTMLKQVLAEDAVET
jgi:PAS domain S-box-containing protein